MVFYAHATCQNSFTHISETSPCQSYFAVPAILDKLDCINVVMNSDTLWNLKSIQREFNEQIFFCFVTGHKESIADIVWSFRHLTSRYFDSPSSWSFRPLTSRYFDSPSSWSFRPLTSRYFDSPSSWSFRPLTSRYFDSPSSWSFRPLTSRYFDSPPSRTLPM